MQLTERLSLTAGGRLTSRRTGISRSLFGNENNGILSESGVTYRLVAAAAVGPLCGMYSKSFLPQNRNGCTTAPLSRRLCQSGEGRQQWEGRSENLPAFRPYGE